MRLELVTGPLEAWFSFLRPNGIDLFKKLLVVNLYFYATVFAGLIIGGALAWLGVTAAGPGSLPLFVLAGVIFVFSFFIAQLLWLASFKVVEEQYGSKRKVSVLGVASENALNFFVFCFVTLLAFCICLLPFLAVGIVLSGVAVVAWGDLFHAIDRIIDFGSAAIALVAIVFSFFLQFSLYEMVLERKGPLECIRESFSLVRKNFWETVIFYFVKTGVSYLVSLPFTIALVIVAAIFIFIALSVSLGGLLFSPGLSVLLFVFIILGLVGYVIWEILSSAADDTAIISLEYKYWRTIKQQTKKK